MRVTEHLARATRPPISFEIIPPRRGASLQELLSVVDQLAAFEPPFIDITSHPAEPVDSAAAQPKLVRKRPGTLGLSALIQHKYGIDAVPHVLCSGFTREETEDFLIELRYLGIENLLALRGDVKTVAKAYDPSRSINQDACELVAQVSGLNRGEYIEQVPVGDQADFCVGIAGYPEGHPQASSMEADLEVTAAKVRAGADYIVTQIFYDTQAYFDYVAACRARGIDVPIIPGLKVLTRKRHLESLPRIFGCALPAALREAVSAADDAQVVDAGVAWATAQAQALLEGGAPSVHFYVMQDARPVSRVVRALR